VSRWPLGNQELELLQYVTEHAPVTVGEAAEHFSAEQGLARTTVATVLERLRAKGYLTRSRQTGPYQYSPSLTRTDLLRGLVRDFATRVLGGSSQPLMQYLVEDADLSEEEIARLRTMVEELVAKESEKW
jgi:predicted transcriptional regulator